MAESRHEHELDPQEQQPATGHERTDVNAWAVGKFAMALALIMGLSLLLLAGLFKYFQNREGLPSARVATIEAGKLPPSPRLEQRPILDLEAIREAEDRLLTHYGWVDRQKGIVRIPVDRAIELVLQRGLPSRPQTESKEMRVSMPTDAALGAPAAAEVK